MSPRYTGQHRPPHRPILPLGAMLFAASFATPVSALMHNPPPSGTAIAPTSKAVKEATASAVTVVVPPESDAETATDERSLKPVTVRESRDRNEQTYQSGIIRVGKTPVAAKDVPQSLTVVTEKLIHDQGHDTLKGALTHVPGITFEAGEGGRIGDNIRLRGFTVSGDIYLDGLRDIAQYNRDTFNIDRVEVLRGAASMLYGRGSTGGVVNQVSKLPGLMTLHELNTTVGSNGFVRIDADLNFKTGDNAALHINTMTTEGDGRANKVSTSRRGLALDYRMGIGTADELLFSLYHLNYDDKPDLGGRWLERRPAPFSPERWYGVDSDYQRDSADMATVTHTHRWADGSSIKTTLRDGKFQRDVWATQIGSFATNVTHANFGPATVVSRGSQTRAGDEHHTFLQSDYLDTAHWFGMNNELLVGAEVARERSTRFTYSGTPAKPATAVGLADNTAVPDTRRKTWANTFEATTTGMYAQDTLSLTPHWKLVAGLRWDRFSGDYDRATGGRLSRSDGVWSKRLGAMFQPSVEVSYYLSYGTSFNTSGDLYQYDPTSAKTPPENSRNMEAGAKWELYGGDLSIRTSLARTDKFNERNTDVNQASGEFLLSGQRHTDSLEVEVAGRLSDNWEVFAGIAFSHAEIDRAGSSAAAQATVGLNPGLTPVMQANLWSTYRVNTRWRIGGGLTAVTENSPASATATALANRAPGYVKVDALVEYQMNKDHALKLNVDNLGNTLYYSSLYQAWPSFGAPRSLRLTWTGRF